MRNFITAIVVFMVICPFVSFSQEANDEEIVIFYDPVFWKDELKLSRTQCTQIRQIDISFYQSISEMAQEAKQGNIEDTGFNELLIDRSRSIWGTFTERQKRRWKKMEAFDHLQHIDSGKSKMPES